MRGPGATAGRSAAALLLAAVLAATPAVLAATPAVLAATRASVGEDPPPQDPAPKGAMPSALRTILPMLAEDRLEEAETALRGLLETDQSAAAHDLLGVVLGRRARLPEAEEQFRFALGLDGDFQPALQHLGRLLLQTDRREEALPLLRRAAELGPLEVDLAVQLATAEHAVGNPDAAERVLRAASRSTGSVRAIVELARLQAARGEHEAAVDTLRPAIARAPNSEEVLATYARSALAGRAPAPAIRALEPLARMHPTVAEYSYLLGVARLQLGESDGAVEALEQALERDPGRPLPMAALGLALNAQKRFDRAREVLGHSLDLDPDSAETLAALAEAEEGLGDLVAAERYATRALERNADSMLAHLIVGKVRMSQRRFAEARDALLLAVEADPASARAHYQLSLAYARLDDPEASARHRELYQEALARAERELLELRSQSGIGIGGMSR